MVDKFPVLGETDIRDEITQIQSDVITYFNNQLDISNVKIPCIFFEGEETELAEVFQRLNSGGKSYRSIKFLLHIGTDMKLNWEI